MDELETNVNDPIKFVGHSNFQAILTSLFQKILKRFETSHESFSTVIQGYHENLDSQIPVKLRKELTDYVVMVMNDCFGGGGYYPKISPFKRIPEEFLTVIYKNYFKGSFLSLSSGDKEIVISLMFFLYIKPFFEYKKIDSKSLEASQILGKIPNDLKKVVIKEYVRNYSLPIEVTLEKIEEMQRKGFLPLEKGQKIIPSFVFARFYDLSRINKKTLLDLVWSVYVIAPFEKRRFTEEKFSFHDRGLLVDLAINKYLELYNHYTKKG